MGPRALARSLGQLTPGVAAFVEHTVNPHGVVVASVKQAMGESGDVHRPQPGYPRLRLSRRRSRRGEGRDALDRTFDGVDETGGRLDIGHLPVVLDDSGYVVVSSPGGDDA